MTGRAWAWLVALSIIATALIGIAGGLDFVSRTYHRVFPSHQTIVLCQTDPRCRAFIKQLIADALRNTKGGGASQNPSRGHQLQGGSRPRPRRTDHPFFTCRGCA